MPLHAVTEIHGEAGLRRRLALDLHRLPGPDNAAVAAAAAWAADLHAGQRRTREPYLNHLLRVTLRMLCHYRVTDPDVLAAGMLHDAVEDQPWAVAGITATTGHGPPPVEHALAAITDRCNPRVARLVAAVTLPPAQTLPYAEQLAVSLDREPWARVIKLSDFTDNGVGIVHSVDARVPHRARKYATAVPILRELLDRPDTPLPPPVRAHIHTQLDLADQRFAAILAA